MRKVLVVIDMQNDFIDGALGTKEAQAMLPRLVEKLEREEALLVFTQDTHGADYLETQEGKNLPVPHCIKPEKGWEIAPSLKPFVEKAEAVVEQYNRDLAAWERQVREKQKPAQKEQAKPPERESVLKRLRQLQAEGKQRNQPRQRKKSFDRDSR